MLGFYFMTEEKVQTWITLYNATFEKKKDLWYLFFPQVESVPIIVWISEAMQASLYQHTAHPVCLKPV